MTELASLKNPPTIHCDNQSSIVLEKNLVVQTSRRIDIKFQFLRDEINKGSILLEYIETEKNVADVFTKLMTGYKIKHSLANYCR